MPPAPSLFNSNPPHSVDRPCGPQHPATAMRRLRLILASLAAILWSTPALPADTGDVTYQVFVRSFADSNGDGIGDLRGLTGKLDYLQDLGVRALWLLPIHPSPSYHQYDVTDYRAIHPDYGTMEDFENFLAEAKKRGLRVILDLVVNHTARDHPWFQAALTDPQGPYHDFYVWQKGDEIDSMTVTAAGPDTDNLRRWHPGEGLGDLYYYAYFTGGMPDLNFDNTDVRREIYNIGKFWLEKGVDGFRLDAAKHIFPDDRTADTVDFWREFRAEMQQVNPDVLLVGEVWSDGDEAKDYLPGLGSVFNFELAAAILDAVRDGKGAGLATRHAQLREAYAEAAPDFVDATFLGNHDQNRVLSVLGREDRARVAAALLLTLPGSPYLYYGEEIGMLGTKPDRFIREPMLWQTEPDPQRPQMRRVRHSTDDTVRPVAVQREDPDSLWHHYRALIQLRNRTPALRTGALKPLDHFHPHLSMFLRTHESGDVLVLHNVSEKTIELPLHDNLLSFENILWASSPEARLTKGLAILPPYTSLLLTPSSE